VVNGGNTVVENSANYTKNEGSNCKMGVPWQSKVVVHWTHKSKFTSLPLTLELKKWQKEKFRKMVVP
jgi:hypothetical protein